MKPNISIYASVNRGCEGLTPNFYAHGLYGETIATYEWDFGDGSAKSNAVNPSHTYSKAGTYVVKLNYTTTEGCKGTVSTLSYGNIEVYKKPTIDFTSPQAPQVCGNNWVQFNPISDVPGTYNWEFGDGGWSSDKNPKHSYREPRTYDVTLTVSNNGCNTTLTKPAFITAVNPFPRFQMRPVDCNNRTEISFDDNSIGNITSWKWSWGDGQESSYTTKQAIASHKYPRSGIYRVKLTVSDGTCTSSDSTDINVYAAGAITISTDKAAFCGHETVTANLLTIDRSLYYLMYNYNWISSDGTSPHWDGYNVDYAKFTNLKPGKHNIRFYAVNYQGCVDSSNKVAVDVRGPVAQFVSPPVLSAAARN